ncbi:MAG: hypothetical protein ABEJ23_03655 [Haloarculaceae archaeon]
MVERTTARLESYFEERVGDDLRSIVTYEPDAYEVAFIRGDVAEQYTRSEIETAVDDSRMESLSAPIYDGLFTDGHGELTCMVKCFESVVEMNFVLRDATGVAVALDDEAFRDATGLVAEARNIVLEERQ